MVCGRSKIVWGVMWHRYKVTQTFCLKQGLSRRTPKTWKQSSITKKLNFLGQPCNLPSSYMAKRLLNVFNIRLTHFQHLDNQSLGFIPDINRILTEYALHHVLDRYLSDGVFPSKCALKRIIYLKTIQRSYSQLIHECVENYPTCAPLWCILMVWAVYGPWPDIARNCRLFAEGHWG